MSHGSFYKKECQLPQCLYRNLPPMPHFIQTFGNKNKMYFKFCFFQVYLMTPVPAPVMICRAASQTSLWCLWLQTVETQFSWLAAQSVAQQHWHTSTLSSVFPSHAEPGKVTRRHYHKDDLTFIIKTFIDIKMPKLTSNSYQKHSVNETTLSLIDCENSVLTHLWPSLCFLTLAGHCIWVLSTCTLWQLHLAVILMDNSRVKYSFSTVANHSQAGPDRALLIFWIGC